MRAVLAAGVSRADRGRARGLLHLQHSRSLVPYLRMGRVGSESFRDRCEVLARAWLPLTTAGARISTS
jgi:hypothetical protein